MKRTHLLRALALGLLLFPVPALAGEALVAVAANFTAPAQEIGKAFAAKTGATVKFSFGSTGKLYTQISQGAPFEVFFAADDIRTVLAEKEGFGVPGSSFTCAAGKLALWSRTPGLVDAKGEVLKTGGFANPVATAFLSFMKGPEALAVLAKHGYGARKQGKGGGHVGDHRPYRAIGRRQHRRAAAAGDPPWPGGWRTAATGSRRRWPRWSPCPWFCRPPFWGFIFWWRRP